MSEKTFPSGALMKRISEQLDKNANNDLSENDVTYSQMKIMIMLMENGQDSVPLKQLEGYFDLSQATVAGLVARMERKKILYGFTDPDDRRIKRVSITDEGKAICAASKLRMQEYERWLLKSLDEDEQEELHRLLNKIYIDIIDRKEK